MSSKLKLVQSKIDGKRLMKKHFVLYQCFVLLLTFSLSFGLQIKQKSVEQDLSHISHPDNLTFEQWQSVKIDIIQFDWAHIYQNRERLSSTTTNKKFINDIVAMIDEFPAIESNEANEKLRGLVVVRPRILILTTRAGLKGRIYYFSSSPLNDMKGILKIGEHFFLG